MRIGAVAAAAWLVVAAALPGARAAELVGFASWPADSFAGGPPSGQYTAEGRRLPQPRFAAQPVQGVSSIKPGPRPGTWWALSDNGFGSRANSFDYRLAIYLFEVDPEAGRVRLERRIELRDPQGQFPWRLTDEALPGRPLTGADADPESLVVMPDGSFWVGEEHGPWLLHFSPDGALLEPPFALRRPDGAVLRSASNPEVLAGAATADLRASKGFEGLAPGPSPGTLLAMLEGPIPGDAADELRLFEFDLARRDWTGRSWRYRLDSATHAAAELAVRDDVYLVIERDDGHGDAARFKRIFSLRLPPDGAAAAAGAPTIDRRPVVDLLDIANPRRLAGAGARFRFPFYTPEAVHALGPTRLLVVADNNFPATGGRRAAERDGTEWIWLEVNP
jgi:glycerophosphoryl diester phosphodiesterase